MLSPSAMRTPDWTPIETFPLDDPSSGLTFTDRLARENGWSAGFTRRVVAEYRRFVYLCAKSGHPVTPSDAVDQAWHLHLCYTDSYWNELCGKVLGFPLHHGPTKGGRSERAKYHDWYGRTLESYERCFGEAAPADIWPSARVRFGAQDFRRVDSASHFILPKRTVKRAAAGGGAALALAGCASGFDGDASPFILFFLGFVCLAVLISLVKKGGGGSGGSNSGGTGCGGGGGGCGHDSGCGSGCGGGGCGGGCGS